MSAGPEQEDICDHGAQIVSLKNDLDFIKRLFSSATTTAVYVSAAQAAQKIAEKCQDAITANRRGKGQKEGKKSRAAITIRCLPMDWNWQQ
jgi:hypothetical protein